MYRLVYSAPCGESFLPFLLSRIGQTISMPVFAYLRRKALHHLTQSIACANAKLCKCQRKALHVPTQSFASVHAKHCISPRKTLRQPIRFFLRGKGVYILVTPFLMFFYRNFTWHKPCLHDEQKKDTLELFAKVSVW